MQEVKMANSERTNDETLPEVQETAIVSVYTITICSLSHSTFLKAFCLNDVCACYSADVVLLRVRSSTRT